MCLCSCKNVLHFIIVNTKLKKLTRYFLSVLVVTALSLLLTFMSYVFVLKVSKIFCVKNLALLFVLQHILLESPH